MTASAQLSKAERVLKASLCVVGICLAAYNISPSLSGVKAGGGNRIEGQEVAYFAADEHHHWEANRYVDQIFIDGGAPVQMLRQHHYHVQFVPLPVHFGDQSLRVAFYDNPKVPTAVLTAPPGFTELGRKDFLAWVSSGRNVVFTGGYATISAMNAVIMLH